MLYPTLAEPCRLADGLPDKVYVKSGTMYYRPNISQIKDRTVYLKDEDIEDRMFGNPIEIKGGPQQFSKIISSSTGFGAAAYVGIYQAVATVGFDKNYGTTTTKTYFCDVNNDGLMDIVHNGKVYFNSIKIEKDTDGKIGSGINNPIFIIYTVLL